jgi:quercetin 2,3-dioxygenase
MHKRVATSQSLTALQQAPGLRGVNVMASEHPIEPFLVFTEFHMDRPVFGPHPHAGVSVMTYILPDSHGGFLNRDSLGDRSEILPGGMHITQAGRGLHHDEVPLVTGVDVHGLQIWINHREADRWVEPKAMHAAPGEIPKIVDSGATVLVLHGSFAGQSPMYSMVTAVTLLDVQLEPHASVTLPAAAMAFVYGLTGHAASGGTEVRPQRLLTYTIEGDAVHLTAGQDGASLIFASGTPIGESLVYGGLFVMTTAAQMQEAKRRYGRGEMGVLPPLT